MSPKKARNIFFLSVLLIALIYVSAKQALFLSKTPLLDRILENQELTIVTRNTPTTYYIGPDGPTGFEYELAKAFADHLGVRLSVIVQDQFPKILPSIVSGDAHIAAAGITQTPIRENYVRFSTPYQSITQKLIYVGGKKRPRSIKALGDQPIDVIGGSSHVELLKALKKDHPKLTWREHHDVGVSGLLNLLSMNEAQYAIADSHDFAFNQRFYPNLRSALTISPTQSLAWAMHKSTDHSLVDAANEFLALSKQNGLLQALKEKHYGHVPKLDYVGAQTFMKHVGDRLPDVEALIKQVSEEMNIDWRLLAAISYQESLWRPNAVSPTGVRGLMMLTKRTARQLNIADREDPLQSLYGGARYYLDMREKIPERISEPDRTWLALAAYNVGYGHLEDARILTQARNGNPDLWVDVRKNLPLLTQKKWYSKTRFGYARGYEPVRYVQNIRNYYDLLIWKFNELPKTDSPLFFLLPRVL